MNRRGPTSVPPPEMSPTIIRELHTREAAIAWLIEHTLQQAADQFGVSVAAVKFWEQKFECRCMRECRRCRQFKPWAEFALNKRGHITSCLPCSVIPKVVLKGRAAEEAEYHTIPDTIYRWLRMPISRDTGYWPIYATRAEA